MQPAIQKGALLAGALAMGLAISMAAPGGASAQPHHRIKERARRVAHKLPRKVAVRRVDFALTYTGETAKTAQSQSSRFWLNGGAVDGAVTFYGDLGLAGNFSVVHSNDIASGFTLGKTTAVFGPRVTIETSKWIDKCIFIKSRRVPPSDMYAEALFGVAHGYDGVFPRSSVQSTSANSSAIQLGVGAEFTIWKHLGVRPFELDYIRTGLANGASNSQSDLRLSFGVTYNVTVNPQPSSKTSVPANP